MCPLVQGKLVQDNLSIFVSINPHKSAWRRAMLVGRNEPTIKSYYPQYKRTFSLCLCITPILNPCHFPTESGRVEHCHDKICCHLLHNDRCKDNLNPNQQNQACLKLLYLETSNWEKCACSQSILTTEKVPAANI